MNQQFQNRVDKVAGRDFHEHHYWPEEEPPSDPEVSVVCPQCERLTWRYTQHCWRCRFDLFKWREDQQLALIDQHRQVVRKRLQFFGFGLAGTAAVMVLAGYAIGTPIQTFANVGAFLFGFAAVKTFDRANAI